MGKKIKTIVNNLYRQYVDFTRFDPIIHQTEPKLLENREIVYSFISHLKSESHLSMLTSSEDQIATLIDAYQTFTQELTHPINIVEYQNNQDYFGAITDINSYIHSGEESLPFEFEYSHDFSEFFDDYIATSLTLIKQYGEKSVYSKEEIYGERRIKVRESLGVGYEFMKENLLHQEEHERFRHQSKQLIQGYLEYVFLEKKLKEYDTKHHIKAIPSREIKNMFADILELKKEKKQQYINIKLASKTYLQLIDTPN